jgi:hypothetical protein
MAPSFAPTYFFNRSAYSISNLYVLLIDMFVFNRISFKVLEAASTLKAVGVGEDSADDANITVDTFTTCPNQMLSPYPLFAMSDSHNHIVFCMVYYVLVGQSPNQSPNQSPLAHLQMDEKDDAATEVEMPATEPPTDIEGEGDVLAD